MHVLLQNLIHRYPLLEECVEDIQRATTLLEHSFLAEGKLLVCGNGGSAADSEHIVTELMKSFRRPRPISPSRKNALIEAFSEDGLYLSTSLEEALPAISLVSNPALLTATGNDISADILFAQQVYGYGKAGDSILGISTSGTSRNVCYALQVGRVLGLHTIGLTGIHGGRFPDLCDVTIRVPAHTTAEIQELHLPVYHTICSLLEEFFFHPHNQSWQQAETLVEIIPESHDRMSTANFETP
jgi:phosphoheptose isomerase